MTGIRGIPDSFVRIYCFSHSKSSLHQNNIHACKRGSFPHFVLRAQTPSKCSLKCHCLELLTCTTTTVDAFTSTTDCTRMVSMWKRSLAHMTGPNNSIFPSFSLLWWTVFSSAKDALVQECFNKFVHELADEMIDCEKTTRHQQAIAAHNGCETPCKKCSPVSSIVHHTPNKRLCPASTTPSGKENKGQARLPKHCHGKGCKNKSIWLCSACEDGMFLCHSMTGHNCCKAHCEEIHAAEQVARPSVSASSQP